MHFKHLALLATSAVLAGATPQLPDDDHTAEISCAYCLLKPFSEWVNPWSLYCPELLNAGYCDPPEMAEKVKGLKSTLTMLTIIDKPTSALRQRDDSPEATPTVSLLIPAGHQVPEGVCELFPEHQRPAACDEPDFDYRQTQSVPQENLARRDTADVTVIGGNTYVTTLVAPATKMPLDARWEPSTKTVTVTPDWCFYTPTATFPVPSWPVETPPVVPPPTWNSYVPPPPMTWSKPTPPAVPSPPPVLPPFVPPPVHSWVPLPPPPPAVKTSTSCTTSLTTITSQPCSTCTPKVWISTQSIPAPKPTPSTPHSSWSSAPVSHSVPSSPSIPVHITSNPPSSTASTTKYTHSWHTYSTTPVKLIPSGTPPAEIGGVGKVQGSLVAMLAFVVAAVVIPAL